MGLDTTRAREAKGEIPRWHGPINRMDLRWAVRTSGALDSRPLEISVHEFRCGVSATKEQERLGSVRHDTLLAAKALGQLGVVDARADAVIANAIDGALIPRDRRRGRVSRPSAAPRDARKVVSMTHGRERDARHSRGRHSGARRSAFTGSSSASCCPSAASCRTPARGFASAHKPGLAAIDADPVDPRHLLLHLRWREGIHLVRRRKAAMCGRPGTSAATARVA